MHGVLNEVKRHFKSDFKIDIDYIGVFEKNKNQEFIITSSSFFVYSYDIKEMISGLNKHTFANNFTALINEREYKNTIAVKVQQFYFLLAIGKNSAANGILIYMLAKDIFEPLFQKIIRVLKLEKSLSSQRYKIITNMNQKSQYVNDIMKSTHYMSNQLQPIKNYFDMLNNIQLYHNKREELQLILDDEKRRAENSLLNIIEKSIKVLDKDENPFIPKHIKKIKFKQIFMLAKKIWLINFKEDSISFTNNEDDFDKQCETDYDTLEYVFTDLFENVRKYSNSNQSLALDFSSHLKIRIENDIKSSAKIQVLEQVVSDYNNNDKAEINKRKNHGLAHIKELTSILRIDSTIAITDSRKFITNLEFKQ